MSAAAFLCSIVAVVISVIALIKISVQAAREDIAEEDGIENIPPVLRNRRDWRNDVM